MRIDRPAATKRGLLESTLTKLFARKAEVQNVETLTEHFRLISLSGDELRGRTWIPGQMIQVVFSGWEQRAYTPISWDAREGATELLAYVHGNGTGSRWVASLHVGETCNIVGPRDAVDLSALLPPGLLFGDETSFATALALCANLGRERAREIEMIFEVTSIEESQTLLNRLGMKSAILIERQAGDRHLDEVERRVIEAFRTNSALCGIFTGNAASIKRIYRALRRYGVQPKRVKNCPYWAVGKKGLE